MEIAIFCWWDQHCFVACDASNLQRKGCGFDCQAGHYCISTLGSYHTHCVSVTAQRILRAINNYFKSVHCDLHTASGLLCTLGYGEHRRLHQWASQSQGSSHLNESWMICCLRFLSAILIASCVVCVIVEWFSCCFAGWGKWLTAFGFSRSSSKC